MSIKLVFNGGLFVKYPAAGDRIKVVVLMCDPQPVNVTDGLGNVLPAIQSAIDSASNVDFISNVALTPENLPMRHLSHILPINYNGFKKVVGFTGGRVKGQYPKTIPPTMLSHHNAAKNAAGNSDEQLLAYKNFHDITHSKYDKHYLNGFVQEFANTGDTRWWMRGYQIIVEFDPLVFLADGVSPGFPLPADLVIEFVVAADSPIPHFPLNNPHVLEQPPTI